MSSYTYKIGIVGPTRVGKTSLITSILHDIQLTLASDDVKIAPDEATKTRIEDYKNALEGSMDVGEFSVGGLEGTQDVFHFRLKMEVADVNFSLEFLDFPGAWMNDDYRKNHPHKDSIEKSYAECIKFIESSTVLLVPLDAAMFMESTTGAHHTAARFYHQINEAENLILQWAKARKSTQTKGLLIFAPVKCEAYFHDNGGTTDHSAKLLGQILKKINIAIEHAQAATEDEKSLLTIKYHPIDTIGGVELIRADWTPVDTNIVHGKGHPNVAFSANYRVRNPPHDKFKPLGPIGIVTDIVTHIINNDLKSSHNIFDLLMRFFKGTAKKLKAILDKLSTTPVSTRVRKLPPTY